MVPQDMQSEAMVPSRPVEEQMPQNAAVPADNAAPIDRMMSGGGKVDRFDPEGKGYDQRTYEKIGSPKYFDERTQEMHGPSASPMTELIKNGVFTEDDIKKYNLPMEGSLLLKGMGYETTPLELEAIKGKYEYKKVPTPLGERYIAFPINKMATGGGVAAGPIGVVDKPGADNSGVADDVPAESDGFVINAAAVRHAGLRDINDMIQDAVTYAEKQGMKLNFGKTPVDAEQILVSNGEVVIPDVIANIIGYDRLEKINNRGKKETEEKIQQQEQQPASTRQPAQPVMQAAEGGQVEELFPGEIPVDTSKIADSKVEKELPEAPYIYKNPETAEFLKKAEGDIAFQTAKGSYDPETKEFLTYPDSKGVDTIGYGTTENVRKNMRISEKVADMALDQRIDKEISTLIADKIPRKFLDNPKTRTALVSLQYNLGRSGWKKAKESLKKGDIGNFLFYAFDPSKEADNAYLIESKGLAKRRNDEKKLFEEGLDELGLN
jgi:GH24 family phage-related lysozyme (muramidase)